MPTSPTGISIRNKASMVMRHSASGRNSGTGERGATREICRDRTCMSREPRASRLSRKIILRLRSSEGFTLIEMLIVLFLLAGVLAIVLPRVVIGEDLSSTGRKFIGTLRTLQGLASTGQKPVKLYLDLDQGTYWARVVDGKEEKLPLDAAWATPFAPAPPILALAIVGPIALVLDLARKAKAAPARARIEAGTQAAAQLS